MTRRQPRVSAAALKKLAESATLAGHERMILVHRRGNSPKNWDRAQLTPGLCGHCIGAGRIVGDWLIEVKVADVLAWCERQKRRTTVANTKAAEGEVK